MSFWNSTLRQRRKAHQCETCGQTVGVGEKSFDESGLYEGDFSSFKQCRACHDIVAYFFWRGTFEYAEGYELGWLRESACDEGLIWPPVWNYVEPLAVSAS